MLISSKSAKNPNNLPIAFLILYILRILKKFAYFNRELRNGSLHPIANNEYYLTQCVLKELQTVTDN